MKSIHERIGEIENSSLRAALCTVVRTAGSAPRKEGAKMLVILNGTTYGSIGGGALEMQVIRDALEVMQNRKSGIFSHALVQDHGMCCGGKMDIFIEPVMNRAHLCIFGAGHIGRKLAQFAGELNFRVTLIDERPEASWKYDGVKMINKKHRMAFREITFDENLYVCVVTHSHAYDREIVAHCALQPHAYLGMIGSRRKVEMAKKTFRAGKILTEEQMKDIDWPMGISIGAQTPEEIAIAILAKLIEVRARVNQPLS